ncbi:MAG: hypothetical protein IPM29_24085 [Planctomycetes bacterium]|nr:hypothetical protein [Planctomycetota bacterium]
MRENRLPSPLRTILWPAVVTLLVTAARLALEARGTITTASGGGGALLGITWLAPLFGAWFGWRLAHAGSRPRLPYGFGIALLGLLAMVASVAVSFGGLDPTDRSDDALRAMSDALPVIVGVAVGAAAVAFCLWPRLAWTLLLYAIPVRLGVLAATWYAKHAGLDTHYTRFGPAAFEFGMAETMRRAAAAQLGFWTLFTVVAGSVAGHLVARLARRKP